MEKIKIRNTEEITPIGNLSRKNKIMETLNNCFEKNSCDSEDNETILRWACFAMPKENLFFLFDKIKHEYLK